MSHPKLKQFANSKQFGHVVNYAIISFAVLVGIETVTNDEDWRSVFRVIDYIYLVFFALEIIIRIFAEDNPAKFFLLFTIQKESTASGVRRRLEFTEHGFWNYFDFALIALSVVGQVAQLFIHPTFFQIGRLFRIFRIIRLLEISEHLKQVEQRIMSIVPTVFSFIILLLILNYIYAILGMFLFGEHTFSSCDFSTLPNAFVTLFQIMTLDNWSDVMKDLAANTPFNPLLIQFYFVSFVVFTSMIAFNVFIAVMTSQVQSKMEEKVDRKVAESREATSTARAAVEHTLEEMMKEVRALRQEVSALRNGK